MWATSSSSIVLGVVKNFGPSLLENVNNNCLSAENDSIKPNGKSEKDAKTFKIENFADTAELLDKRRDLGKNHKSSLCQILPLPSEHEVIWPRIARAVRSF